MTHYLEIGKEPVQVDFTCQHPDIKNNICPTGTGDCKNCQHCAASMTAKDFFAIWYRKSGMDVKE